PGLNNNTLRQVVRVSIGGEQLRVRFSNEYSTSPVILKSAHIAVSTGRSAIDPETDTALSFGGKKMTVIDPGATAISDPCHFLLKPRSDAAITVHFGVTSPDVTGHPGSRTTSYLTTGDMVTAVTLPEAVMTDHWYMIDSIEVLASESARAIVVIGDSITDGRGSGTNKQNRWPDELARRLQEDLETSNISVLNMGIGGNCVLRDCLGSAAITRFKNDVLEQSGVKWLIILEGINDIGQAQGEANASDVANKLIAAYEQMIYHAHNNGILVYGATLLPFGGSFYDDIWRESARQTVNKWIRTSRRFDDVIDLDKAIGDPENPERMLPVADTGDHLHPNETGHKMMAAAVDLDLFKIKSGNKVSD
ncbi:MAG: SGNH/GDSL hydrolase family protein, partial [Deltaproteobacteria bacterium]|nr:SGNH/GDSL hydrolase family protein [Deltaproteobacteria bacterium]